MTGVHFQALRRNLFHTNVMALKSITNSPHDELQQHGMTVYLKVGLSNCAVVLSKGAQSALTDPYTLPRSVCPMPCTTPLGKVVVAWQNL